MKTRMLFAALAALALGGVTALAPPAAAQARRDWTRVIAPTPEGGYRMGNPAAPVKVVEYVSLTCPHCRAFAESGAPQLIPNQVRSGRVSFELRNFTLNEVDEAAAVLNRCAATAAAYWSLNDAILAEQPVWFGRFRALPEEEQEAIIALPDAQRLLRIASVTGLDAIAARHGVTAARARYCLTNPLRLARVRSLRSAGEAAGVQGTPSFSINGRLAEDAYDWATLQPLLSAGR